MGRYRTRGTASPIKQARAHAIAERLERSEASALMYGNQVVLDRQWLEGMLTRTDLPESFARALRWHLTRIAETGRCLHYQTRRALERQWRAFENNYYGRTGDELEAFRAKARKRYQLKRAMQRETRKALPAWMTDPALLPKRPPS